MIDFIQSITNEELDFIAGLDNGCNQEEHLRELRKVIFEQGGIANSEQYWYPMEVYELGSNWLQAGHEREFTFCTLLVIYNVIRGRDNASDLEHKFHNHAAEYDQLPPQYRSYVLEAYAQAGI